jgi:alginate O-acetyltransferase complex protein AlgI
MIFNSFVYAVFLITVFILYWKVFKFDFKLQNILLLVASYFFYSCWDWRFSFLLLFSTVLDYWTGLKMFESKNKSRKRVFFWLSIIINVGFLGVFKYYDFFVSSFIDFFSTFGIVLSAKTLNWILPVGISFYTFHGLSYVIDIYYDRIKPEKNIINYSLFVSFFPLLVAGPIERATHLLPQIQKPRVFEFEKAKDGLRQILWGLFKKVVIADQCAEYVNLIFDNPADYSGSTLVVGAVLFSIQIYGDFSGYSDIALGSARLLGFELLKNFSFPYFSRDIAEFWRRWHISLSSWFRDYLYIPLGGSKGSRLAKIRNTLIIFLVSGFWHGANTTFIIWGGLNALFILPSIIRSTNRVNMEIVAKGHVFPSIKELVSILFTFCLATFAWIFFRSETISDAFHFINGIFTNSFFSIPTIRPFYLFFILSVFFFVEWICREKKFPLENIQDNLNVVMRWTLYILMIFVVLYFSNSEQQFIYFQF